MGKRIKEITKLVGEAPTIRRQWNNSTWLTLVWLPPVVEWGKHLFQHLLPYNLGNLSRSVISGVTSPELLLISVILYSLKLWGVNICFINCWWRQHCWVSGNNSSSHMLVHVSVRKYYWSPSPLSLSRLYASVSQTEQPFEGSGSLCPKQEESVILSSVSLWALTHWDLQMCLEGTSGSTLLLCSWENYKA